LANTAEILEFYNNDARIKQLADLIDDQNTKTIGLTGLAGSQDAFILSALLKQKSGTHVYIAQDKEDAAYILNNVNNIGSIKGHFLPDSFKRPRFFEEIDGNNTVERTECSAYLLSDHASKLVVTYPEALFEKVVDPQLLEKNRVDLKVGHRFDIDTTIELLVNYGFERTDFVYEPGNFSIRGGIFDLYNFGHEWPFRIELFDDEIESIRLFNPTSQLSIEKINEISIIPNINHNFKRAEKVSFFELFSEDTVIWIKDKQLVVDRLQDSFDAFKAYTNTLESKTNEAIRKAFEEIALLYPAETVTHLERFKTIIPFKRNDAQTNSDLFFNGRPQPSFNRNFSLLIEDLNTNTRNSVDNYIFSDNKKQIERFYGIFEDLDKKLSWKPILSSIHEGFIDDRLKIACYTDHQIFERFHRYKLRTGFTKDQAINLKMLRELEVGDFVVHIDHGIGRYSGLEKINISGHVQESVRLVYSSNDILYVGINSLHKISKYVGKEGTPPVLSKIGGEAWKNLKRKTKSKVKDIAKELIKLYAKRKASQGFAFSMDGYLQNELEASFLYEDTPDQATASQSVKDDMMKEYPMDRLICGDVGFGKTEVAIRAAFKAVVDGKQVAILVPTTILALQHSKTFTSRLGEFGVKVNYVNRFKSAKEKKEILAELKAGKLDIIIGTHALLGKEIAFKDLGLLIIDEEQKFGVSAKEKLRSIKVNVDTLTLTATPIPRTLQFSLMAARDLSIIRTPPPNRQPIHTERRIFSEDLIKDAIYYEINRGGQVFIVHNRVKTLPDLAEMVKRMCPNAKVAVAHGQMEADHLEKTLVEFIDGEFEVLVSTNIIETGLDIPNANTIIINNAHQFGMSDLHQLRGRVGRSNTKAFCYLFAPPLSSLSEDARKRLKTLEEFSDLGSGFHIAMKDLDIRGAGDLLGAEQSGFISDIGYETYQKILEEAVHELKETEFQDLFKEELSQNRQYVRDAEIDTDIEMLIPDTYVSNIQERLSLYTQLDSIDKEEDIMTFEKMLSDRFGPVPDVVHELFDGLRLRWKCKFLGFEKLSLKAGKLRCYFVGNAQSSYFESPTFQSIMNYVSSEGVTRGWSLKQTNTFLILIRENVRTLQGALNLLNLLTEKTESIPTSTID
jgi:transcription-repair coupling factor (superfamily II helicase)